MINYSALIKKLNRNEKINYLILLSKDVTSTSNIIKKYTKNLQIPELNFVELDGETIVFNDLNNAVEKLPFMDNYSVVLVTKANFITSNGKDPNKILKSLNKLTVPSSCVLILQAYIDEEENPKKNTKIAKLEKQGATVVYNPKFTLQEGKEELKKRNIIMLDSTVSYIYEKVGDNLDVFINECEKISMIPKDYLNPRLLDGVITKTVVNSVFDIIDVLIRDRDLQQGLNILNNLMERGSQPLEIFGALHSQIKLIYYAKQFELNGKGSDEFAKTFKLHPFRAQIGFNQAKLFTLEKISNLFIYCNDVSNSLKFSANPKIELEKVIVKLFE